MHIEIMMKISDLKWVSGTNGDKYRSYESRLESQCFRKKQINSCIAV